MAVVGNSSNTSPCCFSFRFVFILDSIHKSVKAKFFPHLSVAMISMLLGVLEYHKFILYIVHDDLYFIFGIEQRELLRRLQICSMHVECVT